jgi:transcription elongation factor GreA-like protein
MFQRLTAEIDKVEKIIGGERVEDILKSMKKTRYHEALYKYGILTLCYLIREYEETQNFEECAVILEAIREHNEVMKDDIPTKYEECLQYLRTNIRTEYGAMLTEEKIQQIPGYALLVKRMMK